MFIIINKTSLRIVVFLFGLLVLISLTGCNNKDIVISQIGSQIISPINEVVICSKNGSDIYCQKNIDECKDYYETCRIIRRESITEKKSLTSDIILQNLCSETDHKCNTENGEKVVCRGDFKSCSSSFFNCSCGVENKAMQEIGQALNNNSAVTYNVSCLSGVFVCENDLKTFNNRSSTMFCKSSLQKCMSLYSNCTCMKEDNTKTNDINSTKQAFDKIVKDNPVCSKSTHRCKKENGIIINCDGSFDFCRNFYKGQCVCGIDSPTDGFLTEGKLIK